ncbi:MAG: PEP-CTERM sorting domain-containing protein [Planctomycetes bacterium]|nr:PEP-CTERM sorting domain-containing protein [Planctomycetota bacterium]
MQSLKPAGWFYNYRPQFPGTLLLAMLTTGVFLFGAQPRANAAVFASGDVLPQQEFTNVNIGGQMVTLWVPNLPSAGGQVTDDGTPTGTAADLIVGGTGMFSGTILENGTPVSTTMGIVTINSPTNTLPLIAPNINIGQNSNGIGRVSLNDFGTTMIAETLLTIGDEGQGELRITNGSRVNVGTYDPIDFRYENGETIIGSQTDTTGTNQYISEGIVVMDGFGSLLETDTLMVADEGLGTIELSGQANLVTLDSTLGDTAGSLGRVTLTGLGTRWNNVEFDSGGGSNAGKIIIGNNGSGIVDINDQALVVADIVEINPTSFVNLAGGTLFTNNAIINSGVIRGSGRIESDLTLNGTGDLRNTADVNNVREYLYVTGIVTNDGTIESIGGEMEFESAVTNNLEIIARDAIMRFNGGLVNNGSLSVGGNTIIHGSITGTSGITVLTDSAVTLVGDITFSSGSILSLAIGAAPGTLDITGSADLTGALFDLNYSAGVMSQPGDSYQIFQANGGILGFIGAVATADSRIWDITQSGNTLIATATGAIAMPVGADFNGDGIVNGLDLSIWEANLGTIGGVPPVPGDADGDGDVDGADFMRIQMDLGGPPTPAIAAGGAAVVPEPSSALLLVLGSLLVGTGSLGRRRR